MLHDPTLPYTSTIKSTVGTLEVMGTINNSAIFYDPAAEGVLPDASIRDRYYSTTTGPAPDNPWTMGNIYVWNGKSWVETTPSNGSVIHDSSSGDVLVVHSGSLDVGNISSAELVTDSLQDKSGSGIDVNGLNVFNGGITFLLGLTPLNFYKELSLNLTWVGPWEFNITAPARIQRIGNWVNLWLDSALGAFDHVSDITLDPGSYLPAEFRMPSPRHVQWYANGTDNSVPIRVSVDAVFTGNIGVGILDDASEPFTAGFCGFARTAIGYSVEP